MQQCDNNRKCHNPAVISDDSNATRVICKECWNQHVIRKDWRGVNENRMYSKIFRRDILQGGDNLFYKYHPEFLRT